MVLYLEYKGIHSMNLPSLAILALFDEGLAANEHAYSIALIQIERPQVLVPGKPGQPNFDPIAAKLGPVRPHLTLFITQRYWLIFHQLKIPSGQLDWL